MQQQKEIYSFRKNKAVKGLATVAIMSVLFGTHVTTYANELSNDHFNELSNKEDPTNEQVQSEIQKVETTIQTLKEEIKDLNTVVKSPEEGIKLVEENQATIQSLTNENEKLSNSLISQEEEANLVKQNEKDSAQLKETQNELDSISEQYSQVDESITQQQKNVDLKKEQVATSVTNTKEKVNQLKSVKERVATLEESTDGVSSVTNEDVQNIRKQINTTSQEIEKLSTDIASLQEKISRSDEALGKDRKITLSDTYIENLKLEYKTSDPAKKQEIENTLKSEFKNLKILRGRDYFMMYHNEDDSFQTFNVNNLPVEIIEYLNKYAVEVINDVRKQVGTKELKLSNSSIDFASNVAKEYKKSNFSTYGHSSVAVNKAGQIYNLKGTEDTTNETGIQAYESLAYGPTNSNQNYTIAQLKDIVFAGIHDMILSEHEWGHADHLLRLNSDRWATTDQSKSYLGVSLSHAGNILRIHYLIVDEEDLTESKNFDTTFSPKSETGLSTLKESLQKDLDTKTKLLREKQSELDELKVSEIQTKALYNKSVKDQETKAEISKLKKEIETLENEIKNLETASKTLQENLDKETKILNALKDKEQSLKVNYATKYGEVKKLTDSIKEKENTLSTLTATKKKIQDNKVEISKLEKAIDNLKESILNSDKAKATIKEKEELLKVKEIELENLKAKLRELSPKKDDTSIKFPTNQDDTSIKFPINQDDISIQLPIKQELLPLKAFTTQEVRNIEKTSQLANGQTSRVSSREEVGQFVSATERSSAGKSNTVLPQTGSTASQSITCLGLLLGSMIVCKKRKHN